MQISKSAGGFPVDRGQNLFQAASVSPQNKEDSGSFSRIPSQDKVSFSARRGTTPPAQIQFFKESAPADNLRTAVRVDHDSYEKPKNKLLGVVQLTSAQEQQIRSAETKAFQRYTTPGYSPKHGSIQAKVRQGAMEAYQPGFSSLNPSQGLSEGEQDAIMDSLKDYGEDLAAIALTGRDRKGAQRYLEDKFFINLFDRDRDDFEDYFKGGFKDFVDDKFSSTAPEVSSSTVSSHGALVNLPDQKQRSKYKTRWLRPSIGVSLSGIDFKKAKVKPKIDIFRLQGPSRTEVRLRTELPYKFEGGLFEPEVELNMRRMFNEKQGEYGDWNDNLYADMSADYNMAEEKIRGTVGVRKQLSPDSSMGMYGLYQYQLDDSSASDIGLGVNYQSRFN